MYRRSINKLHYYYYYYYLTNKEKSDLSNVTDLFQNMSVTGKFLNSLYYFFPQFCRGKAIFMKKNVFEIKDKMIKKKKQAAISMMRGKLPHSEFILEIIKSNNSLRFKFLKRIWKWGEFYLSKYNVLNYFTFILIKK